MPEDVRTPEPGAEELRRAMVRKHIRGRGISHPRLLEAMERLPREPFLDEDSPEDAYADHEVEAAGRRLPTPYATALLLEWMDPAQGRRVLDVGGGPGYRAALAAAAGCEVFAVVREERAADRARAALDRVGIDERVRIRVDPQMEGWGEEAPFDRILLPGAGAEMPAWVQHQLAPDGQVLALAVRPASEVIHSDVPAVHIYEIRDGALHRAREPEEEATVDTEVTEEARPEEMGESPRPEDAAEAPRPRDARGMNPGAGG